MKQFLKRFIIIASLIVLPLLFEMLTQNRVDHNTLRIQGFYQEEDRSLDVIVLGASEVFTGYSPGQAYEQFGFTSYAYAIDGNYSGLFVNQLKEVLAHQTPKCILIETSEYANPVDAEAKEVALASMRKWTDAVPLSANKIETINQHVDSDKLSYYLPFLLYHGLPSNLSGARLRFAQQLRGYTYLKGLSSITKKSPCENLIDVSADAALERMSDADTRIFLDLLDYCKTLDCKVVFICFPHRVTDEYGYHNFKVQNSIEALVRENGFDFIHLDKQLDALGLLTDQDFYGDSHLNPAGQFKLTAYLGKLLQQEYGITPSVLSPQNKERWDRSAAYTALFYQYYFLHENDGQVHWMAETPEFLAELEALQ